MVVLLIILRDRLLAHGSRGSPRFSLGALLAWMSVAAVILTLYRIGPFSWGWTIRIDLIETQLLMLMGCGAGLVGFVVLISVLLEGPWLPRILLGAGGAISIGFVVAWMSRLLWEINGFTSEQQLIFVASLAAVLYLTWLPLQLVFPDLGMKPSSRSGSQ